MSVQIQVFTVTQKENGSGWLKNTQPVVTHKETFRQEVGGNNAVLFGLSLNQLLQVRYPDYRISEMNWVKYSDPTKMRYIDYLWSDGMNVLVVLSDDTRKMFDHIQVHIVSK
jgi:hypothetical protein